MPLTEDDILGVLYIEPQKFLDKAHFFGAGTSLAGYDADGVKPLIAMASRAADAECGREFTPDSIVETHRWQPSSRRISVNQPPVISVQSYKIITAPGQSSTVSPDQVLINNQENYLELAAFAVVTNLITTLTALGITEPQIEVTYKSYDAVPAKVAAATGFIAAKLATDALAAKLVTPGLTQVKLENTFDLRRTMGHGTNAEAPVDIPVMAKLLLREFKKVAIG